MGTEAGVKLDEGKIRYELIPPSAIRGLAEVLTFGANKYIEHGWMTVENAEDRYTGALMRHLEAWREGEEFDPESGLHHLKHVITNAAFLLHFDENYTDEEHCAEE